MKGIRKLRRLVGRAIADYEMIVAGDRVCVGLSGGKDSLTLLMILLDQQKRAPVDFSICAVCLDQGLDPDARTAVEKQLRDWGIEFRIDPFDVLRPGEFLRGGPDTYCFLCARRRRGTLYTAARDMGANRLALAHHRDDAIETLLMNMFFSGRLMGMPAALSGTGTGKGLRLIRPLIYVPEALIIRIAQEARLPVAMSGCPLPCRMAHRRAWTKDLLARLAAEVPTLQASLLRSMSNVHPEQMLLTAEGLVNVSDRLRAKIDGCSPAGEDSNDDEARAPLSSMEPME